MSRILVLSPHPDDEAIGCGGALLRHAYDGDRVRVVCLTSGERGCPGRDPASAAELREGEARSAGAILGIESIEFWKQPDGLLRATQQLRQRLHTLIDSWRPDLVYVPHSREMHPDHRAAARLVRATLAETDGRPAVRMYEVWTPLSRMDELVDVTDFIDRKIDAIRAHHSQCALMQFDEAACGLSRYRGIMHCWPEGDYAEAFMTLRT